ncbi:MAG: TadE/TadG family type IV pilus assembly protein [Actinomycetota bacterium]
MRTLPDAWARSERGSAVVEFALVLPLVLVVVLGLVQVGLVARDRLLVEAAARAGARAAAVDPDDAAIAETALAAAPGLDPALASVSVVRAGARGDPVTVRIVYDDPVRVPLVGWLVGSGVTMTASATDRQEFG